MKDTHVLTTGEAARWCGVSFMTVLRWIKSGRLKAHALPGRGDRRIRVEDFREFLREHRLPLADSTPPAGRRILVVDDDALTAKLIARTLAETGASVETALDGFSAGARLARFNPHLVTLDLRMPGLGGLQVVHFIRSIPELRNTRILVVSGLPPSALAEARKAGADAALRKPIDGERLKAAAAACLGKPPARRAAR